MTLSSDILSGDRTALARAITLIESTREDHQREAQALLTELWPRTGHSIRIGITGAPGVGKSTFIEALGLHVIEQGYKLAVLAIDPSSTLTGGAILGDKTRMGKLAQNDKAFIRPTAAAGSLGGVARRTREAMLLCEAAGYDIIIVETVGVGQSETEVADMTDMLVLLLSPGGGDELQGIKRGIVELADLLIVNKADGDLAAQAKRTQTDYAAALRLLRPSLTSPPLAGGTEERAKVLFCSALERKGIAEAWQAIEAYAAQLRKNDVLQHQRRRQAVAWMWKDIREMLMQQLLASSASQKIAEMEESVMAGKTTPLAAAQALIEVYRAGT